MGLFDSSGPLGGMLGQLTSAALPSIIEKVFPAGMQGVLNQLQESGLGQQVNSWLGRGANEPITVDQLRAALDNEQVKEIAAKLGVSVDKALELLAGQLPAAVDQQSPDGDLKTPPA